MIALTTVIYFLSSSLTWLSSRIFWIGVWAQQWRIVFACRVLLPHISHQQIITKTSIVLNKACSMLVVNFQCTAVAGKSHTTQKKMQLLVLLCLFYYPSFHLVSLFVVRRRPTGLIQMWSWTSWDTLECWKLWRSAGLDSLFAEPFRTSTAGQQNTPKICCKRQSWIMVDKKNK